MNTKSFVRVAICALLLLSQFNYAQSTSKESTMRTEEQNKLVIRKIYEEALNKRKFELLKGLVADEYTGVKGIKGVAGVEAAVLPLIQSFPDIQWKVEELIAEANKVVVKWKWQGLNSASYQNLSAINKIISNEAIAIYELKNQKVIAARLITDRLGFLQQMEALPQDIALITNKKPTREQLQFIDQFRMPLTSKQAFTDRMKINRSFLKTLPGFIADQVYERTDENGTVFIVTVASWEDEHAVKNAKEKVQELYRKEGFNMTAFLEQWKITLERGLYKKLPD